MEHALRALRQLSAGLGNEAWVFKAASLVPAGWEETTASAELVRQGSDSESEEEILDIQQPSVKLSELYTWGRATNYQLGYGVSGNEQQIPKLVQLPIGKQVMHGAQNSCRCGLWKLEQALRWNSYSSMLNRFFDLFKVFCFVVNEAHFAWE